MKRVLIAIAAGLVIAIVAVGGFVWYMMGKPLYEPGMVRAESDLRGALDPPDQPRNPGIWQMETDIELTRFMFGVGPPVLVVHGGPGQPIAAPPPVLQKLAPEFTFHYYDQRGCGDSTRPFDRFEGKFYENVKRLDRALGLGAQIADIERIRRILGEEKIILLGHSFGGFIATLYAAEFPEHVERLVLVAPADLLVMPADGDDMLALIEKALPEAKREEYAAFLDDEYLDFGSIFDKSESELVASNNRFAEYYVEAVGPDHFPPGARVKPEATGGWGVQALYLSMGLRHDYRDALAAVRAPVLVLHGTEDLVPVAGSQRYVDLLRNARLVEYEGGDHFLLYEQDPKLVETVGAFLRGDK